MGVGIPGRAGKDWKKNKRKGEEQGERLEVEQGGRTGRRTEKGRDRQEWAEGWTGRRAGKRLSDLLLYIMETDRKWVVVRIDGKIAAISTDYRMLAKISADIARKCQDNAGKKRKGHKADRERQDLYEDISAQAVGFDEIWKLRESIRWEDLMLFGTDFQIKVWRKLWDLTDLSGGNRPKLISYSDFAELCQNRAGVRAVAHAIGLNPISVIIPCHLVVPKESIDRIRDIQKRAESTIFKGEDLCLGSILTDTAIDFGEYASGKDLKRALIIRDLT